uniref:Uncharacterized protein n=1 Tax=Plectus sambesii TaxID=2011161 RepID=A0A914WMP4_9BILA
MTEGKKIILPPGQKKPFYILRDHLRNTGMDMKSFSIIDAKRRLPTFTNDDWRRHLFALAHAGQYFPRNQEAVMAQIKDGAISWIEQNNDSIQPIDYYNFLSFLRVYQRIYRILEPNNARRKMLRWFLDRYQSLQSDEFFPIFWRITFLLVQSAQEDEQTKQDIAKMIAHAVELAGNADIYLNLRLLQLLHQYSISKQLEPQTIANFEEQIFALLRTKELPANQRDLFCTLRFVADIEKSYNESQSIITKASVFRAYARRRGVSWDWLRNSIELVFSGDDSYYHIRQPAALAAVRAYKWKAIPLLPEDVNRYIELAAEPYLTNPAILFEPQSIKGQSAPEHYVNFAYLLVAIKSAALTDLRDRGVLTVRLDGTFWDRFFATMKTEVAKLNGRRTELLRPIWIRCSHHASPKQLSSRQREYLTPPHNRERYNMMKDLIYRYATVTYDAHERME